MNKKISIILAFTVVITITFVTAIWISKNDQEKMNTQMQSVTNETASLNVKPENPTSQEIISDIKPEYKTLSVSDGVTAFSFEIPEGWLTETRHSGEKHLTVEDMRDFLATNYHGDIKTNPNLYSDYYYRPWSEIKKMNNEEVEKAYSSELFPVASVAASDYIWYTDVSWRQIDFYFQNEIVSSVIANDKKEYYDRCKEYSNYITCKNNAPKWSKTVIDGKNVNIKTYPTDKDKDGNELISKGGTGGKVFYIEIPNSKKTVKIIKQAKGDVQFENDFKYLIQTLKFEK